MVSEILFPFFDIMVNTIFGSIGLSLAALAVIMVIILALCRTSWVFMLYWMMFYIMVTFTFYLGLIGIVITLIITGIYFITQIVRLFFPDK
jgi:hypothetical protein